MRRFDFRGIPGDVFAPVAALVALICLTFFSGCYAPLHSRGIPASSLPDEFRMPYRTVGGPLNYAQLTTAPPQDYLLGPHDILDITVPGLYDGAEVHALRVQVMGNGEIFLPVVGAVRVGGMNLLQAQRVINQSYAAGVLHQPCANVVLAERSGVPVLVLGNVQQPGLHVLPKYQNDVGHALAAAQGLTEDAADVIEVHRRWSVPQSATAAMTQYPAVVQQQTAPAPCGPQPYSYYVGEPGQITTIALRGPAVRVPHHSEIILEAGDVVVVPGRRNEVFYVVGKLNQTNTVRFTIGDRERELGVGLLLPRDREIGVVTAVAMAGYIDPIDSPTTVTVHRLLPDGSPMLILVDLIAARYNPRETVLVQPGDIIYLNPDANWWMRRTLDRVVVRMFTAPYEYFFR